MKQNFADKHLFEIIIILKNSIYIYVSFEFTKCKNKI